MMRSFVQRHSVTLAVAFITAAVAAATPATAAKIAKKARFAKNAGMLDGLDSTAFAKPGDISWGNLQGIPSGFADGTDDGAAGSYTGSAPITVTGNTIGLSTAGCATDELWKYDGSDWSCESDADSGGDITGVTAGSGLLGGGSSGDVGVSVDTSAIQSRVTGACSPNSSIQSVAQNGTVTCETDDNTTYTGSDFEGIDLNGTAFRLSNQGCSTGEVWRFSAGLWSCDPAASAGQGIAVNSSGVVSLGSIGCSNGHVWRFSGGTWSCAAAVTEGQGIDVTSGGQVGLDGAACASGDIWKWTGTMWSCDPDANSGGDITGVTTAAGSGLTGGNTSGNISLALSSSGCAPGGIWKWTGSTWSCLSDAGSSASSPAADLECSECVDTDDIANGTIQTGDLAFNMATSHDHFGQTWNGAGTTGLGVETSSSGGVGLLGTAASSTGGGIGVSGLSSGSSGRGVSGVANHATGTVSGVHGQTTSTSGRGVVGEATAGSGTTFGVLGTTASSSGAGVMGTGSGTGVGVRGFSNNGDHLQGGATGTPVFRVDNDGDVFADRTYHCGQNITGAGELDETELEPCLVDETTADFAEMLPARPGLEPGDVLVIGADGKLDRSRTSGQRTVLGVHSTRPSYLGNAEHAGDAGWAPLAVSGVVPVNAIGPIQPGDLLMAADEPGHATTCESRCRGRVIGKALTGIDSGTGTVSVLLIQQ